MILKILGASTLLGASVLYGNAMIREGENRIKRIAAFVEMIEHVRDNIEHFATPLGEIFSVYTNEELEKIGFLATVRAHGIACAVSGEEGVVYIDDAESAAAFSDFCRKIGGGYKEDELRLCDYTLGRMRKRMNEICEDHASRVKLYRAIPPLFAMSLSLILL